jgi:hypothetical protein
VLLLTTGAVKLPLLEMVPAVADQVTAVFEVPVTLAVNCCTPREAIVVLPGETTIAGPWVLAAATTMWATPVPWFLSGSETSRLKL